VIDHRTAMQRRSLPMVAGKNQKARSSKLEARNKHEIPSDLDSKQRTPLRQSSGPDRIAGRGAERGCLQLSSLKLGVCFGFRVSDFGFHASTVSPRRDSASRKVRQTTGHVRARE
jgi:hypothetical protein